MQLLLSMVLLLKNTPNQHKAFYIGNLVTHPKHHSKDYGAKLLLWLKEYATKEACQQLHLDSGIQQKNAHRRLYERESMIMASFHFVEHLSSPSDLP